MPSSAPTLRNSPNRAFSQHRNEERACGERFGEDGKNGKAQRSQGRSTELHTWKEWEQEQKAQAGDRGAKAEVVAPGAHGLATARGGADLWE